MPLVSSSDKVISPELENSSVPESSEANIPTTFLEALDALDRMSTEEAKDSFRNDEDNIGPDNKQLGMQLRNSWGLWSKSALWDYFSERGVAHADWITAAIFEGWIERLKSGSVNEVEVITKYAKIEKDWREWNENAVYSEPDEDGWRELIPPEQKAEQAVPPKSDRAGG